MTIIAVTERWRRLIETFKRAGAGGTLMIIRRFGVLARCLFGLALLFNANLSFCQTPAAAE